RVFGVDPSIARHRFLDHRMAGGRQPGNQITETFDQQCRMRFARRAKLGFDTKMNFEGVILEPGAAAPGQIRGVGALGNSEHALIERQRALLPAFRHGELDMLDCANFHSAQPICSMVAARGGSFRCTSVSTSASSDLPSEALNTAWVASMARASALAR